MKRSIVALALIMAGFGALAAVAQDNSIAVTAAAAMGPPTSAFGLEVTMEAGAVDQAFVMAGPDKGFADEGVLKGSFFVNPQASGLAPGQYFQMLVLMQDTALPSDVKVIFFLHRDLPGNYFCSVWHYDEGLGNYTFTNGGFFALPDNPTFNQTQIEFEWTAGDPGNLKVWRTLWIGGMPDPSGQILIFDTPVSGQGTAAINYVFAGMFNKSTHPGIAGTVYLDEFEFRR